MVVPESTRPVGTARRPVAFHVEGDRDAFHHDLATCTSPGGRFEAGSQRHGRAVVDEQPTVGAIEDEVGSGVLGKRVAVDRALRPDGEFGLDSVGEKHPVPAG